MIEIIEGTFAAGETKTWHINGEYLELLDAQYQCDVYLMDKSGAQLSIMKKCEASFFSKPSGGFNTVQISSSQAQFLRFFVGSGDAGTRRISSVVQVVDGARARTNALVAFGGTMPVLNVAAQYSQAQLWNPAASGKLLVVNSVAVGSGGACNVYLSADSAQMASVGSTPANKRLGGAVGSALIRKTNLGTIQPASVVATLNTLSVGTGVTSQWRPTEPVVVPPGFGLSVSQDQVNLILTASFEWFEEAI